MRKTFVTFLGILISAVIVNGQGTPANLPSDISSQSQTVTPTRSKNYILTKIYLEPVDNPSSTLNTGQVSPAIEYFDGLGRTIETVSVKASQLGNDMIGFKDYDVFGRLKRNFLPYSKSANNGTYIEESTLISNQNTFLSGIYGSTDGSKGYSETTYESSPLNRVLKQGAPGAAWQVSSHPVNFVYKTNTSTENIQTWRYTGSSFSQYTFGSGALFVSETVDEDSKPFKVYTDIEGKTIQSEINGAKTRYCYDEFGRLRCVVQPGGASPSSVENCFFYNYDIRGRLTGKRIPGKEWEYFVYDVRDRLVLTQDGEQRKKAPPEWIYTVYDNLNRPVENGKWPSTTSHSSLQTLLNSSANLDYIKNRPDKIPLSYLHYDDYQNCPSGNAFYSSDATALSVAQWSSNTGRLTWTETKAPDAETDMDNIITSAIYYDRYGRVIQTVSDNHLNGKEYVTQNYNFSGQVTRMRTRHYISGESATYFDLFNDYNHRGRLMKVRHSINGANEKLLSAHNYDETGNLIDKYLHSESGGPFLQRNDYTFNIRGWLTQINDPGTFTENDKFGLQLYYNTAPSGGNALYNGNITGMGWGTPTNAGMLYRFSYDNQNRFVSADFYKNGFSTTGFDTGYTYDLNGNIASLTRYDNTGILIDSLTFHYSGNRITKLSDGSGDVASVIDYPGFTSQKRFTYDDNGNVTIEPHKLLNISYNILNLPEEIGCQGENRKINYYYTFKGEKLRKKVENNGVVMKVDYCGPFVYEMSSGVRTMKYLVTPEGRAVKNGSSWDYEYNLTDHLGNVRAVIRNNGGVAQLIQERHYYPFGMEMSSLSAGAGTNKYLYNGKEYQDEFGLSWYDYGARFYDPQIGRFHTIDPMAEDFPSWAPYHYVHNNPIVLVDPSGMSATKYEDEDKNLLLETNDGSDAVVTVTNDKRAGFDAAVKGTKNTDDVAWNNSMKEYALGFELSDKQESLLSSMNSDWSRRTAMDYWKTGNFGAGVGFAFKEALSQWTNPELVVTGLAAGLAGYSAYAAKTGTSLWPAASGGRTVSNGVEYTTHALERMQPVGTIMKGTEMVSRGVPVSAVENAIKYGTVTPGRTAAEVVRTFENVRVITDPAGTRVITVLKLGH